MEPTEPLPCPYCKNPPTVKPPRDYFYPWEVACKDHYDGPGSMLGYSYANRDNAVEDWNEQVEEWHEKHAP